MTPEQTATLLYVVVVSVVSLGFWAVALLWREYRTLTDDIPGNHITAAVRAAWRRQPGAFLGVFGMIGVGLAYLAGHLFWGGGQ